MKLQWWVIIKCSIMECFYSLLLPRLRKIFEYLGLKMDWPGNKLKSEDFPNFKWILVIFLACDGFITTKVGLESELLSISNGCELPPKVV